MSIGWPRPNTARMLPAPAGAASITPPARARKAMRGSTAAAASFLLLFPGFFFYQTALGLGKISAFLGGYFSICSLAVLPFLAFCYIGNLRRMPNYFRRIDFCLALYLLYFFCIVMVNFVTGTNRIVVVTHLLAIVHTTVLFLTFRMLDASSATLRHAAITSLLGMSIVIFSYSVDVGSSRVDLQACKLEYSIVSPK